jgi:hypothetical protein
MRGLFYKGQNHLSSKKHSELPFLAQEVQMEKKKKKKTTSILDHKILA